MEIKFECPKCGLAMQSSTDAAGFTAQCPVCGQQFGVEADPPAIPVVKGRTVGTVKQHPPPHSHAPHSHAPHSHAPHSHAPHSHAPHSHAPPSLSRARPLAGSGAARPRLGKRPVTRSSFKDKLGFIGLAAAFVVLAILAIGVPRYINNARSLEEKAKKIRIANEQEAATRERERVEMELAIQAEEKAKKEEAIKLTIDQYNQEREVQEGLVEQQKKDNDVRLKEFANRSFNGDIGAAQAFITAWEASWIDLSDRLNDADRTNAPRTANESVKYLETSMIRNAGRDRVLSQWMRNNKHDPEEFILRLLHGGKGPVTGSSGGIDITKYASTGSGFFVSSNGYILTNEHVVTDAEEVDFRLSDGKTHMAKVVRTDKNNDLALLKADLTTSSWLPVSTGREELDLGDLVFTVGYPDPIIQGSDPKYTNGTISAKSGYGGRKDMYQISVPVQHGNSGGALVHSKTGWVVGVVNARLEKEGAQIVNYAIKAKMVRTFFDSVPEASRAAAATPEKAALIKDVTASSILILRKR